ncbi:MAG: MBL fold metallo-hydrolase, partial [Dehalococcoidia bacterium]
MPPPPAPLVLGDNNVWPFRLDEGGWLLVDAGLDYLDDCVTSWEVLVEQARAIGCTPDDVRVVVVTHEHIDHAGLAARWAGYGAAIVAMPEALPMLIAGRTAYGAIRDRRLAEMRDHGCPTDVLEAIARAQAAHDSRRLGWEGCAPGVLVEARDGDTFALEDGRTLHLIAAPGHTPGNLVAFVADAGRSTRGDLCSGDTLLPTTVPTPGLQFPAIADLIAEIGHTPGDVVSGAIEAAPRWPSLPPFLRSVERLRALDVRRILPGHGEVVDDPARLFAQFEAHHARRAQRVRAHLERAGAAGDTAYGVVRGLFPRLPAARIGQALTETIGHLDLLVEREEATQDAGADGTMRTWLVR